jgi:hypothetical protein
MKHIYSESGDSRDSLAAFREPIKLVLGKIIGAGFSAAESRSQITRCPRMISNTSRANKRVHAHFPTASFSISTGRVF